MQGSSNSTASFQALLTAFIVGAICASVFILWRVGGIGAGVELQRLRAHNDSVTVQVKQLVHAHDSLVHVADSLVQVKNASVAVSDSLTKRIQALTVRRGGIPAVVKQLPDTGVASRFRELIK